MGFRTGSYCTVWEVEPKSSTMTKARISVSKKNKQTGEYETEFSGYVAFVGTNAANKALSLKEKDRIKLGDVDVTNTYDKEKKVEYTNFKVFSFDVESSSGNTTPAAQTATAQTLDGIVDEDKLPF